MAVLADAGRRRLMECGAEGVMGRRTLYNGWDGGFWVPVMIGS